MKKAAKDLRVGDRIWRVGSTLIEDQSSFLIIKDIQIHRPAINISKLIYRVQFWEAEKELWLDGEATVDVGVPESPQEAYSKLLAEVCPRVIKTEEEYDRLLAIAENYTFQESKTEEERDLYALIVLLIEKYESRYTLPGGGIDWGDVKAYQAD